MVSVLRWEVLIPSSSRTIILVITGCLRSIAQIRCCCDMGMPGSGWRTFNHEVAAIAWYR